eukprot:Sspe_Gene.75568::Locus_47209_Transcript_1_1_Confidence_1.000_Length_2545::g.75568::m.75568
MLAPNHPYIAFIFLLLCLPSRVFSTRIILVANAPPVANFYFSKDILNRVVPELKSRYPGYTVAFVYPTCPNANCEYYLKETDVEKGTMQIVEAMWNDTMVEQHVAQEIGANSDPTFVIGVNTPFPTSLVSAFPNASFVSLQVGHSVNTTGQGTVIRMPFLRAAYLSGAIAAMSASDANKRVAVLVPRGNPYAEEVGAFRQGIADAKSTVCVTVVEVSLDTRSRAYRNSVNAATDMLNTKYDVIYPILAQWDQPVIDVVTTKSLGQFQVFVITGPFNGVTVNFNRNSRVWLSRDVFKWTDSIDSIIADLSAGRPLPERMPDTSETLWTATWNPTTTIQSGTPAEVESEFVCGKYTNRREALKEVATQEINPDINIGAGQDGACVTPPPLYLTKTSEVIWHCTDDGGSIRLVGVAVYITILGNVDMKAGSFYADFNLYLYQHKGRYRTNEQVDAVLRKPDRPSVCGGDDINCLCPAWGQNELENFVPGNQTDNFHRLVNVVTTDRFKAVIPVFRPGEVGDDGTPVIDFFRYQSLQYFQPTLSDWPLDTQQLTIALEGIVASTTTFRSVRFCHMDEYSGLSPKARYFPGMDLTFSESPWQASIITVCWPYSAYPRNFADETCQTGQTAPQGPVLHSFPDVTCSCLGGTRASSRYTFALEFKRPQLPAFLKIFLPPMVITATTQGVWFLHPKLFETRLGVCGSSLVSAVMYHVSIAGSTPETSIVTLADRFMAVVYFNNLLAFLAVFIQTVLFQAKFLKAAWKFFQFTRVWGVLLCISSFIGTGFFNTSTSILLWIVGCIFCCAALVLIFKHWLADSVYLKVRAVIQERDDDGRE